MEAKGDIYLERVRQIVLAALAGYPARVYLFGSRAEGAARARSDVDIAIEPCGPLPRRVLADLREALEESTIPYRVDVVDLREAGPAFRARVKQKGLLWSDCWNA